ncbi:unnamed protein product [Brachionus calyciflorus]|uniref:Uncharacterized protein n=1 Tax=Brachionus calyciflorus TaxID=104777 RepID=A0A814QHH4_9BILA|nr:unnamed protein product [Brachionus calyciflorus]
MDSREGNSNAYVNPIFLNDDLQPPPYISIYPFSISVHDSKINETSLPELFQNSSEPISYDQLYLPNNNLSNQNVFTTDQVIIRTNETNMENRLRKQFNSNLSKSYLIRHILFISLSSLTLISFQIVLMNNESVLSQTASGLWCGFGNLFTLLSAILAIKYSKLWLLISTIMLHFLCITLNLGALIVINCIATTRYSSCNYPTFNSSLSTNCNESNLKYGNIAMIVIGASCMLIIVSQWNNQLSGTVSASTVNKFKACIDKEVLEFNTKTTLAQ